MVLSNQADGELESPSWPKHEKRARIEKNLTQACLTAFRVRRATPGSQSKPTCLSARAGARMHPATKWRLHEPRMPKGKQASNIT